MLDDAGNKVELLRAVGFAEWPSKGDPRIEWVIRRIRMAFAPTLGERIVFTVIGIACGVMFLGTWLLIGRYVYRTPGPVVFGAMFALGFGLRAIFLHILSRRRPERVARVLLDEGLCPTCGYNLHGAGVDQHGRVTCPECGGAWNSARIRTTAPFIVDGGPLASPIKRFRASKRSQEVVYRDDTGERFALTYQEVRKRFQRPWKQAAERQRVRALRRAIRLDGLWWRATLGVCILIGLGSLLVWVHLYEDAPLGVVLVGMGLTLLIAAGTAIGVSPFFRTERRVLLANNACPICVTSLHGVQPDPDALTSCPGCRARWKSPYTVRTTG